MTVDQKNIFGTPEWVASRSTASLIADYTNPNPLPVEPHHVRLLIGEEIDRRLPQFANRFVEVPKRDLVAELRKEALDDLVDAIVDADIAKLPPDVAEARLAYQNATGWGGAFDTSERHDSFEVCGALSPWESPPCHKPRGHAPPHQSGTAPFFEPRPQTEGTFDCVAPRAVITISCDEIARTVTEASMRTRESCLQEISQAMRLAAPVTWEQAMQIAKHDRDLNDEAKERQDALKVQVEERDEMIRTIEADLADARGAKEFYRSTRAALNTSVQELRDELGDAKRTVEALESMIEHHCVNLQGDAKLSEGWVRMVGFSTALDMTRDKYDDLKRGHASHVANIEYATSHHADELRDLLHQRETESMELQDQVRTLEVELRRADLMAIRTLEAELADARSTKEFYRKRAEDLEPRLRDVVQALGFNTDCAGRDTVSEGWMTWDLALEHIRNRPRSTQDYKDEIRNLNVAIEDWKTSDKVKEDRIAVLEESRDEWIARYKKP